VSRGAVGSGTLTTSTDHVLTGCAEGVGVPERAKLVSACAVPRLAAQRAVLPLLLEPLVRRGELGVHAAAAAPPPASPLPPRPSAAAPLCRRPPRRRWRAKVAQVGAGRRLELLSLPPPPLPLAHLTEDRSDRRRRRHLEDIRDGLGGWTRLAARHVPSRARRRIARRSRHRSRHRSRRHHRLGHLRRRDHLRYFRHLRPHPRLL